MIKTPHLYSNPSTSYTNSSSTVSFPQLVYIQRFHRSGIDSDGEDVAVKQSQHRPELMISTFRQRKSVKVKKN